MTHQSEFRAWTISPISVWWNFTGSIQAPWPVTGALPVLGHHIAFQPMPWSWSSRVFKETSVMFDGCSLMPTTPPCLILNTHVMSVMASRLPVDPIVSTEVCFVRGAIERNKKTDWLEQVCFWAKLSGMQRHEDSSAPLFKTLKLLLEHPQWQQ